jgi:hypothetical protein
MAAKGTMPYEGNYNGLYAVPFGLAYREGFLRKNVQMSMFFPQVSEN